MSTPYYHQGPIDPQQPTPSTGSTPNEAGPTPPIGNEQPPMGAPQPQGHGFSYQQPFSPTGGPQQSGPYQPRQHSGFFHSLRWSGWYRAEPRVFGGVCSGIAARFGWDPILVRGLTVITTMLCAPLMAAYGLAWLFLPEQRDGRIHCQELIEGRFDPSVIGAAVMILLSVGGFIPFGFVLSSGITFGWAALALIVILIVVVVSVVSKPQRGSHFSSTAYPPHHQQAEGHRPMSSQTPSWNNPQFSQPVPPQNPGQAFSTPPPQQTGRPGNMPPHPAGAGAVPPGNFRPPVRQPQPMPYSGWIPVAPKARVVGLRENLIVTGLVFVAMSLTFGGMYFVSTNLYGSQSFDDYFVRIGLIGGGICLLIAGLALVSASIRDRGASWLVGLSIIGMALAIPAASIGGVWHLAAQNNWYSSEYQLPQPTYADWTADSVEGNYVHSDAHLDLSEAPEGTVKTIVVQPSVWGTLHVTAREDQAVKFICRGSIDNVYADNAPWLMPLNGCDGQENTPHARTVQSPSWNESNQGFTIIINTETELEGLGFYATFVPDLPESHDGPQSGVTSTSQSGVVSYVKPPTDTRTNAASVSSDELTRSPFVS